MPRGVECRVTDERILTDGADGAGTPTGLAVAVGALGFLVVFLAAQLALVNTLGPFGQAAGPGLLAALTLALVVGAVLGSVVRAVAMRSRWGLVALVAGLVGVVVVLFPTGIDRHESFRERANERSSCLGLTFSHYPPGTADGSSDVYCVGLERPLPAG